MNNFETIAPVAVFVCAVIALAFSMFNFFSVKKKPEGTDAMKAIGAKIRKGAMAYLKRQYKTVGIFFAIMFVILLVLAFAGFLTPFVPFAFLTGGFFSGLSGFIGMQIQEPQTARSRDLTKVLK